MNIKEHIKYRNPLIIRELFISSEGLAKWFNVTEEEIIKATNKVLEEDSKINDIFENIIYTDGKYYYSRKGYVRVISKMDIEKDYILLQKLDNTFYYLNKPIGHKGTIVENTEIIIQEK